MSGNWYRPGGPQRIDVNVSLFDVFRSDGEHVRLATPQNINKNLFNAIILKAIVLAKRYDVLKQAFTQYSLYRIQTHPPCNTGR